MYLHHQLNPPTSVDLCHTCCLIEQNRINLVISLSNVIEIYDYFVNENKEDKLVIFDRLEFYSNINCLGNLRGLKNCDYLLIGFSNIKISVLIYNQNEMRFNLHDIFDLENEYINKMYYYKESIPKLISNSDRNCASILFDYDKLAFIYLKDSTIETESFTATEDSNNESIEKFVAILSKIDPKFHRIVDLSFMNNYYNDTIGILYEPLNTCFNRSHVRSNTFQFTALSIDRQDILIVPLWSVSNLPHDSFKLLRMCSELGGITVVSSNSLIYINQTAIPYVLYMNESENTSLLPASKVNEIECYLEHSIFQCISSSILLCSTSRGDILMFYFVISGQNIKEIMCKSISLNLLASCSCLIKDNIVFLGSRLQSSLLLNLIPFNLTDSNIIPEYQIIDRIYNYGCPISSCVGYCEDKTSLELCHICPVDTTGYINIMHKKLKFINLTSLQLENCKNIWFLKLEKDVISSFIIISYLDSTIILQSDSDIVELEDSLFITSSPTLSVYNTRNNDCIIQVCPNHIRIFSREAIIYDSVISNSLLFAESFYFDPFIFLKDVSNNFYFINIENISNNISPVKLNPIKLKISIEYCNICFVAIPDALKLEKSFNLNKCLIFAITLAGAIYIYSFPDNQLIFTSSDFYRLPFIINSSMDNQNSTSSSTEINNLNILCIKEIKVFVLGQTIKRIVLFVICSKICVLYELRFLSSSLICLKRFNETILFEYPNDDLYTSISPLLKSLNNFNGSSCVFLSGPNPMIITSSDSQIIDVYNISTDTPISNFISFSNENIIDGFISLDLNSNLNILSVDDRFVFNKGWMNFRTPLNACPLIIQYHPNYKVYFIACKLQKYTNQYGLHIFSKDIADTSYTKLIHIYEENETISCMRICALKDIVDKDRTDLYLVVSTIIKSDETNEYTYVGKIYIYKITPEDIKSFPTSTELFKNINIQLLINKEFEAGISCFDCVDNTLIVCANHKAIKLQYNMENKQFEITSSVKVGVFTTSIKVIKNIIVMGDISGQMHLLHYQKSHNYLSTISKRNVKADKSYCVEYLVSNKKLETIMSLSNGDIFIYSYSPEIAKTRNGSDMYLIASAHFPSIPIAMFRVHDTNNIISENIDITWIVNNDGSASIIIPLTEKLSRRHILLSNRLNDYLPDEAGFNLQSQRNSSLENTRKEWDSKIILDSILFRKFLSLDLIQCHEISKKLGMNFQQILEDILTFQKIQNSCLSL